MTTQRNFLDGPCQISQGFLLPFKDIRGSFGLPERLKIVLEQPADTPQFCDGVQIRMGGNPASEKTSSHIFRQGQPGDFRLLREARFFLGGHSESEQDVGGIPAASLCAFFASHAFCL